MNPEIEKLIKIAIADGEITDKERSIILRKAESLGLDKDEIEMILEGELTILQKQSQKTTQNPTKSNKEGDLKKCPSCGAPVQSFSTKCSDCGHEFRNIKASHSILNLFELITQAEAEERGAARNQSGVMWNLMGVFQLETQVANRIATVIASFPIPNTKEDILEFLSQAISKSETKSFFQIPQTDVRNNHNKVASAWKNKCQEIVMKARFSMKDDKRTLGEIEQYAKQLKIK